MVPYDGFASSHAVYCEACAVDFEEAVLEHIDAQEKLFKSTIKNIHKETASHSLKFRRSSATKERLEAVGKAFKKVGHIAWANRSRKVLREILGLSKTGRFGSRGSTVSSAWSS